MQAGEEGKKAKQGEKRGGMNTAKGARKGTVMKLTETEEALARDVLEAIVELWGLVKRFDGDSSFAHLA